MFWTNQFLILWSVFKINIQVALSNLILDAHSHLHTNLITILVQKGKFLLPGAPELCQSPHGRWERRCFLLHVHWGLRKCPLFGLVSNQMIQVVSGLLVWQMKPNQFNSFTLLEWAQWLRCPWTRSYTSLLWIASNFLSEDRISLLIWQWKPNQKGGEQTTNSQIHQCQLTQEIT